MPKTTFLRHPLHTQLVFAPAALLPFALAMDLLFRRTRKKSYRDAAFYSLAGGVAAGAVAGAAGAMDYVTLPPASEEKRVGTVHAVLNAALFSAAAANVALRLRGDDARSPLPLALSALGGVGVFVSAWYGAHLVYRYGFRVQEARGTEQAAQAPARRWSRADGDWQRTEPVPPEDARFGPLGDQVCSTCDGSGTVKGRHCPACGGSGHRFSPGQRLADDRPPEDFESYHVQPNFPP